MVTFRFRDFGENLGTRQLGQQAREKLMPLLEGDERVVLDFTGVDVVSNSFADECIAKLLLTMSLAELKAHTTFQGLNPIGLRKRPHRPPSPPSNDGVKLIYRITEEEYIICRKIYSSSVLSYHNHLSVVGVVVGYKYPPL
ncbi:MAG: STAS-like domain-containing protein [Bacteroidales bacterium]|nr:STAS-like domain-containing protein [Bacteroidales bacterium]